MTQKKETQKLIEDLPDLVLAVRRDGTLLAHCGGRQVAALVPDANCCGKPLEEVWPEAAARAVKQLCRKAIAARATVDSIFSFNGVEYEGRATATAPDRANCVIRPVALSDIAAGSFESSAMQSHAHQDRRRFLPQLQEAIALAALKEAGAALIVIELKGISDIAEVDYKLAENVLHRVIVRLRGGSFAAGTRSTDVGQIGELQLGVVIDTADRKAIERFVSDLQQSVQEPVRIDSDTWHLSCHAGVSLLGRDSNSAKELLDQARIAAGEARRSAATRPRFFSDTMKLKSVARLDIARELARAVRLREIGMRYLGRYDLSSGRLDALVGYVTWRHPMRGDVAPKEFLNVAEASGAAVALSREMLRILCSDFGRTASQTDVDVRFSYGPLRNHLLRHDFIEDIEELLDGRAISPERLEVRVGEATFVSMPPKVFERLHRLGVRTVVDEVGRSMNSLAKLAAAPLWGMQMDRVLVEDLDRNQAALRLCRAGIGAASALGLCPIAMGVDVEAIRHLLLESGCRYGSGDLFENRALAINFAEPDAATA